MTSSNLIPPFPPEQDRDAFGHWLSGFTDGEGCFGIFLCQNLRRLLFYPKTNFTITLRSDDDKILRTIMSFFQCGYVNAIPAPSKEKFINAKPMSRFSISKIRDLVQIVIPHFEKYQLRAKKAVDFSLWKEAVILHWNVTKLPRPRRKNNASNPRTRWTSEKLDVLKDIIRRIRKAREFCSD
jgi:hypothetical protein